MGTVVLKLAPIDPLFVPTLEQVGAARKVLLQLAPDGYDHAVRVFDVVEFIDPGEYLSAAICPVCRAQLSFDAEDQAEMAIDWIAGVCKSLGSAPFRSLHTSLPCCGHSAPLASVEFQPPALFASCELRIFEPLLENDALQSVLHAASQALGVRLQIVWAEY